MNELAQAWFIAGAAFGLGVAVAAVAAVAFVACLDVIDRWVTSRVVKSIPRDGPENGS